MPFLLRKRILIVDDDPALLEALPEALLLRIEELEIDTAASAATALEQIERTDYDAIIADIKMPGINGLELLQRVRALRPETPTLLITGFGEHDLVLQALRGGAYDYIQKPINRDYFVAVLKRALQMVYLRRQAREQRLALEQRAALLAQTVQERTHTLMDADRAQDALMLKQLVEFAEHLRNYAAELGTIIESIADGVYVCDASGRMVRVNASGAALLGVTMEELSQPLAERKGGGPYHRLDGSPLPAEETPLAQALRGVTRTDYLLLIRHPESGEDRQVQVSAAPIRNHAGEITGAVAVASDISALYQTKR